MQGSEILARRRIRIAYLLSTGRRMLECELKFPSL